MQLLLGPAAIGAIASLPWEVEPNLCNWEHCGAVPEEGNPAGGLVSLAILLGESAFSRRTCEHAVVDAS